MQKIDVNNVLIKQYLAEGKTDAWWHYMSKNEDVEVKQMLEQ